MDQMGDSVNDDASGLNSSGTGVDEEGIVNFLEDAIGAEVGIDILREFSLSDAFAELMDVVTSSLTNVDGDSSRKQSIEESEDVNKLKETDAKNKNDTSVLPYSSTTEVSTYQNPNDDIIKDNKHTKKSIETTTSQNKNDQFVPSNSRRQMKETIQKRLKVKIKFPFSSKKDKFPETKPQQKSLEDESSDEKEIEIVSQENKQTKEIPVKVINRRISSSSVQSMKKSFSSLHATCMRVHNDLEFRTLKNKYNLNPCCVILCDLINMGSMFRNVTSLGGGGDASLSISTVKTTINLCDSKTNDLDKVERMKRNFLSRKLINSTNKIKNQTQDVPHPKNTTVSNKTTKIKDNSKKNHKQINIIESVQKNPFKQTNESLSKVKVNNVNDKDKEKTLKFKTKSLQTSNENENQQDKTIFAEMESSNPKRRSLLEILNKETSHETSKESDQNQTLEADKSFNKNQIGENLEENFHCESQCDDNNSVGFKEPAPLLAYDHESKTEDDVVPSPGHKNKREDDDVDPTTPILNLLKDKVEIVVDPKPSTSEKVNNDSQVKSVKKPKQKTFALIDSDSDDEEEDLKPRKLNKTEKKLVVNDKDEESLGSESSSGSESETSDIEIKSKKFGRVRDKEDVRTKKFIKLESERLRKLVDKKKEVRKKESRVVFKPDQLGQGKMLENTFRIPKKHSYQNYNNPQVLKGSTPLAKQEIPDENLKFEKYKKRKGDNNDDDDDKTKSDKPRKNFKKFDNKPKHHHFEPEILLLPSSSQLPPVEKEKEPKPYTEPEVEWAPTVDDEPDTGVDDINIDEGSLFGDRSNDSPLPPLSEVQVGELAKEVSELIRDGSTDLPSLEDSACITEGTAQKCAWWFSKNSGDPPPEEESKMQDLETAPSSFNSDDGSNYSFTGNLSNSETDECQVHEISSTSRYDSPIGKTKERDPDKVDEYCGRSLLQAKIRIGTGDTFKNIFDLRAGALYEKENFQAKCNLCNQLIVGRRDLATHIRGITHKDKLRKIDQNMGSSDQGSTSTITSTSKNNKVGELKSEENKNGEKKLKDLDKGKDVKKDKDKKDKDSDKDKISKIKRSPDKKGSNKKDPFEIKKEPMEMEIGRTSTGLEVKVPVPAGSIKKRSPGVLRRRTRSRSQERSRNRQRSRSRSRDRRRIRKSRSPIRRIARSPTERERISRKSKSPAKRDRSQRKRVTSSEERVKEFLARTVMRRSKSPTNGYQSKRSRRSRSKSPQIAMKKDNKEFHEKLGLTAEGKWNPELEQKWKLMEAEEAMFREQFYDRQKIFISTPEDHPKYADEWAQFWERRYQEVEQAGKDPEAYDFVSEWKEYWTKRLNLLLQEEADIKIDEIKKKYHMDYESLSKLRKGNTVPVMAKFKTEPRELKVLPAHPVISTPKQEQLYNPSPKSVNSDRASLDNLSAKSMSISDNEFDNTKKIQASSMPPVTIEDFKTKWEALTRPKLENQPTGSLTDGLTISPSFKPMQLQDKNQRNDSRSNQRRPSGGRSEITTSSDSSYDFCGFDLVQVLRLMGKCEDQLSFLAPKVLEYFKMAEELELAKRRGSYVLLENQEFVGVLFQARDRFMTMIRSNVLSKDVLQSVNMSVYALNSILDLPQCQKLRPQLPTTLPELEVPATTPGIEASVKKKDSENFEDSNFRRNPSNDDRLIEESKIMNNDLAKTMSHVPLEQKTVIAAELSKYLISVGRQGMSNSDLMEFLQKILSPLISSAEKKKNEKLNNTEFKHVSVSGQASDNSLPNVFGTELECHSTTARIYGVTSTRVVGSALPILPSSTFNMPKNAGAPRVPANYIENHSNEPPLRNSDMGPGRSRHDSGGGRRSPFSQRDYSGNPLANPGRF